MTDISTAGERTSERGATHHAPTPLLARIARFSARRPRMIVAFWLLLIVIAAPLAIGVNGVLSGAGWDARGSESAQVRSELQTAFPGFSPDSAVVVYQQSEPVTADSPGLVTLLDALASASGATGATNPFAVPAEAGLISADGKTVLIPVGLAGAEDADLPESAGKLIGFVNGAALPEGSRAAVTGEWPMWSDFNKTNEEALHKAELLSGVPSLIFLFLAFGAALAAGIPLLLAVGGIAFGFGALYLLGSAVPLSVWAMNFSMMIGLAVGIDYSLFIVSRYREERWAGKSAGDAIETALSTSGFAVLLSALSVILSLAVIFIVPVMVFQSMALGMMLSVAAVAVSSLTLLPAVLVLLGDRVLVTRSRKKSSSDHVAKIGIWERWTGFALNRPGPALLAGLALLLALVVPANGMKLGMPDARVVEEGRSSRDGFEMLVSAFGEGAAAPIYVITPAQSAGEITALAAGMDGAAGARIVTPPNAADRVVIQVTPSAAAGDASTTRLIDTLRDESRAIAPATLVGGPAAQSHDLTAVLTGRAPYAIGIIMLGALLMLLVIFRSLVIAVSSVLLNLLSVAAAFGFATLLFQHGFGVGLIGVEHQGFVDAWAPIFFFALLFGLSMDYQLFLLAAIRERYDVHGNTQAAVREALGRTSRPITNAALIMIVVFIAFGVTGPIPPTELGLTLAFAVLLDATLIRMLLMPAIMSLLGERNWWLPGWLDRILPRVSFKH